MPRVALIILSVFFSTLVLADSTDSPLDEDGSPLHSPSDNTFEAAPSPNESEKKGKNHTAERFVMPVTQWLEKKAHQSRVLNPTGSKVAKPPQKKSNTTLRQAISKAQNTYPGTVLSATRFSESENTMIYAIKILSAEGVIKEIRISNRSEAATEDELKSPTSPEE